MTACAPVLCEDEKEILFVYANELVPECYGDLRPKENLPLAFAAVISLEQKDKSYSKLALDEMQQLEAFSPADFLRRIL